MRCKACNQEIVCGELCEYCLDAIDEAEDEVFIEHSIYVREVYE